jgi:hypothetical protein
MKVFASHCVDIMSSSGFVLEGQMPWELPEKLIGAARVSHLNVRDAVPLDINEEIPLLRPAFVTPV